MKAPIYIVPDDIPDQQMLYSNILAPVISYDTVPTNTFEHEQPVQSVQPIQSVQSVQPVQHTHEWQTQSTPSPPILLTQEVDQEKPYIIYKGTRYVLQPLRNNST